MQRNKLLRLLTVLILFSSGSGFSEYDSIIIARGDNNYPPYEFLDSLGNPAGFDIDLLNAIARQTGINVSISLGVWDSVRNQLINDEIDMISGMLYSREREKEFAFSVPYLQVSHALFVTGKTKIESLEDLEHREVLVQKGDIMHDFVRSSIPSALAVTVENPLDALMLLENEKYDCALLAYLQGLYLIKKNGLEGIESRKISLPPHDYCFAVRKENQALLTRLNEGLNILRQNGTYRRLYLQWFGVTAEHSNFGLVMLYVAVICGTLLLIIAAILLWNSTLRKTVNQRTMDLEAELKNREEAEKTAREKHRHLRLIADNMPVLIAHVDADETYLYANRAYSSLTGWESEKIVGRKTWEIVSEHYYTHAKPYVDRAIAGERVSFNIHTHMCTGEMRDLQVTYVPSEELFQKKCGFFALTQDVTEFVRTENALRESETNLSITLNSIGDAVIATDSAQKITRMNPIAQQLTGWCFEEARGKVLTEVFRIINAHTRQSVESPAEKVLREGRIVGLANHTVLISKDGTERQIADSGAPIRNANQEIVGVVLVFRDVTENYRVEEQLRQSQKMDAIGKLAGGIAHDFNNQLAGIMGYADLIRGLVHQDTSLLRYCDNIIRSSQCAADLTNKLLAFARKGNYQSVPVNLHSIIGEVVSMLEHTIDRRITIRRHLDAAVAVTLGDPSQLQSALLNLAINARDAMPDGGELIFKTQTVVLSSDDFAETGFSISGGHYVRIQIKDTGTGIDSKVIPCIFEPFFTTKEQGMGTGMGLAAVYGTMKNHHGAIDVESKIGEGTTFNLLFPLHEINVEKTHESGDLIHGAGNILIVDDEMLVCEMASDMLEELGYSVVKMLDGEAAVNYYRHNYKQINLVILDLVMPRLGGVDTFYKLRQINESLTVLVSSGYSIDGEARKILKYDRTDFLQKPYKKANLSQAVAKIITAGK